MGDDLVPGKPKPTLRFQLQTIMLHDGRHVNATLKPETTTKRGARQRNDSVSRPGSILATKQFHLQQRVKA